MFLNKMTKIKQEEVKDKKQRKIDVFEEFKKNEFNIISEIKKASPSKGNINLEIDVNSVAKEYLSNGATALSILTEEKYFKGNIEDLKEIRKNNPNSILLRKDFILDEFQVYEAKFIQADMILIILSFLEYDKAKKLINLAFDLGLEVLLEVHDEQEMKQALTLGTNFIGVNNRNLKTLEVDLENSRKLAKYINKEKIFVCESGLSNIDDIIEMKKLGYNSFLIGSHFMQSENQGEELRKIISGIKNDRA